MYRLEYDMLCRGEIPTASGTPNADTDFSPMNPSPKPTEQQQTEKITSIASRKRNICKSALVTPAVPGLTPGQIAREHFCEQGLLDSVFSNPRSTFNSCFDDEDLDLDILEDSEHPEVPTAQTTPATKAEYPALLPDSFFEIIPRDTAVTTPITLREIREDHSMFHKIR